MLTLKKAFRVAELLEMSLKVLWSFCPVKLMQPFTDMLLIFAAWYRLQMEAAMASSASNAFHAAP